MIPFINQKKKITCMSQVSLCLHICREHVWKGTANNGYPGSGWGYGKCCAILYAWLVVPVVCVCVCFKVAPLEDEL